MTTSILKGRKLFLIDAIGAVTSALSLLIPYAYEEVFGMPKSALSLFISIAIVYVIYSSVIYLTNTTNWKFYLVILGLLNISYCLFTGYHILKNMHTITLYGYLYFGVEILIVFTLSIYELKSGRTLMSQ